MTDAVAKPGVICKNVAGKSTLFDPLLAQVRHRWRDGAFARGVAAATS